ncbi:MAG: tetratricopeptide repeat protein, partial [Candidatus Eremiobacterota bacterium]
MSRIVGLVLIILVLGAASLRAEPQDLQALEDAVLERMALRDYAGAIPVAERLVAMSEQVRGPEHPDTARSLFYLAYLYDATTAYAKAEDLYLKSLRIREKVLGPEHADTVESLAGLGGLYMATGDYARARPLFQRALAASEKTLGPEHPTTARSLKHLAGLYSQTGEYAEAEPLFLRALAIEERTLGPDSVGTAVTLNNLALLYQSTGAYSKAEPMYRKALEIVEKRVGPDHPGTATCLSNLAELYLSMGAYPKAEPLFRRALRICEAALGPEHPDTASSLDSLARVLQAGGAYDKAEPLFLRALAIREKVLGPEHPDTANSLTNLAQLYYDIRAYSKAEPLQRRALAILEKVLGAEHPYTAILLSNLAGLCRDIGDPAQAERLYRRALAVREKALGPDHPDTANSLDNLAQLYHVAGDYARAEPLYRRALSIREKALGPDHPDTATSLNNLGLVYHEQGDLGRAEPLYRRALAIREQLQGPDHPETATCLENLAYLELDAGRPTDSLTLARRAQQSRERVLANVLSFTSEKQRLAYQATANPYSLAASLGSAPDVARAVLRHKGIVLDSLLEDVRLARAGPAMGLVEELRASRQRLLQLTLEPPRDPSPAGVAIWRAERDKQGQEVERLEASLARQVAGLGVPRRALTVTVEQVQAALPEDAALVEFLRYTHYLGRNRREDRYGAVVVPFHGPPRWIPLGPASTLERAVRGYQRFVRRSVRAPKEGLEANLRGLYGSVWAPLEAGLPPGTRSVILSPDGELSFVSFATLLTPEDRFLGQQYTLMYVASGRDLLREDVGQSGAGILVVGNPDFGGPRAEDASRAADTRTFTSFLRPLPGSAEECAALEAVAREAGWPVQVVTGAQATEERVAAVHSPRVLHLATHGFFLSEITIGGGVLLNPMHRSGLALAGARSTLEAWRRGEVPEASRDGILTAQEVGALDLRGTWLAVLSACETGQGEARAGEGVIGLRRGFLQAGTDNLLMTLWPVADAETARFITDFYAVARQGNPPRALAEVQREWLVRLRDKD